MPRKKVVSEKQLAANRRNAKKSTGPRTSAGKARACRNSLRHGLLAKDVVVTATGLTEKRADFDAYLGDLCRELRPVGVVEETLVERIATCYWRLRRVQRFEVGAIGGTLDVPDPAEQVVEDLRARLAKEERALSVERRLLTLIDTPRDRRTPAERQELDRSITSFARVYRLNILNALARLTANDNAAPPSPVAAAPRGGHPDAGLCTAGILPASDTAPPDASTADVAGAPRGGRPDSITQRLTGDALPPDGDAIELENQVRNILPTVIDEIEGKVADLREQLRHAEDKAARVLARRPHIASLPDHDALIRVVRYENMLDRQIHRALAALGRIRRVPRHDTSEKQY